MILACACKMCVPRCYSYNGVLCVVSEGRGMGFNLPYPICFGGHLPTKRADVEKPEGRRKIGTPQLR